MIYALRGVKARIEERFPVICGTLNSEFSTAIPEPRFLDTEENLNSQLPSIEIFAYEGDTDYGDEDAPILEGFEGHVINIEMVMSGNNRADTGQNLLLYREAVKRIVKEDDTFGGRFHRVMLGSVAYSDMYQMKDEKTFLKICRQTITVRQLL